MNSGDFVRIYERFTMPEPTVGGLPSSPDHDYEELNAAYEDSQPAPPIEGRNKYSRFREGRAGTIDTLLHPNPPG